MPRVIEAMYAGSVRSVSIVRLLPETEPKTNPVVMIMVRKIKIKFIMILSIV
jgi:hypothetical protein